MQLIRLIIESTNRALCFAKKNRRTKRTPFSDLVKINLGCGLAVAKGWINIDGSLNALFSLWPEPFLKLLYKISGANRYYSCAEYCGLLADNFFIHHDLSYGIPFRDKSVDFIYSSHFLEHLFKNDAENLLKEAHRVLKPGGLIRISVPNLAYAISLYNKGDKEKMLTTYFFVEDIGSQMARHKYMYDFELMEKILKSAGFSDVIRYSYQQGICPDIGELDNRPEDSLFY